MSNVLQTIRGRLNSALNTVSTPPVAPVGGISPIISLADIDNNQPCFAPGNIVRTVTAAPAAGATLVATPSLDTGSYDFRVFLSADGQAATRTAQLIITDAALVTVTQVFDWRFDANLRILIDMNICLQMAQNQRLRLVNGVLGANTFVATMCWRKRLINP